MSASNTVKAADSMEEKLTKINTLTKQLSKISLKNDDATKLDIEEDAEFDADKDMDADLAGTKYWKDYHDYYNKLGSVKKEIKELRDMNAEYTGDDNFEVSKYQDINHGINKAIKETNNSYKKFNGIDAEYFN